MNTQTHTITLTHIHIFLYYSQFEYSKTINNYYNPINICDKHI